MWISDQRQHQITEASGESPGENGVLGYWSHEWALDSVSVNENQSPKWITWDYSPHKLKVSVLSLSHQNHLCQSIVRRGKWSCCQAVCGPEFILQHSYLREDIPNVPFSCLLRPVSGFSPLSLPKWTRPFSRDLRTLKPSDTANIYFPKAQDCLGSSKSRWEWRRRYPFYKIQ